MKNVEKTKEEKYYFSQKQLTISNPNLKFKEIITTNNYSNGFNDIFEIFISIENKEVYLASANKNEYKILSNSIFF